MPTYVDRAVKALQAYLQPTTSPVYAGFPAFLRAIETAESLAANFIPNPVAYERAFLPHDTRSVLVQIYEGAFSPVTSGGNRNRLTVVDLTFALSYTSDSRLVEAEDLMRLYVSAMIDSIEADPQLGGRVNGAWWTDGDRTHPMFDQDSTIRHVRAIGVTVHVHDPD